MLEAEGLAGRRRRTAQEVEIPPSGHIRPHTVVVVAQQGLTTLVAVLAQGH